MQHIPSVHPKGTIILASAVQPRYYEFTHAMERLKVPAGTKWFHERSCDATSNFNSGLKKVVGDWVWFMGDDHQFHEDTLLKLLDRQVDVVVPISPCKVPPWAPCVLHGPTDGRVWHENMPLYTWDELSGDGLLPLPVGDFIGQAGMLIRKSVLDRLSYPWFEAGQLDSGRMQEDLHFCRKLQQLGITVHIDQDVIFDHWFIMGVTARKHQGQYVPALRIGDSVMVLPDAKGIKEVTIGHGTPRVKWKLPHTMEEALASDPQT